MYYFGIDLHWDNCYITTVDDAGAIVKQQRVVNSPEMLLNYFRSMDGPHRSVVESTMGWYWLDDLLGENGIERFPTVKHFLSCCRLVPGAENSNRHIHHRSSKDDNKYLKCAFSDAGVRAMQYFPEYRAFYRKMLKRSNQPIARAVVAKEIAKIVYYVLTNHSPYRGLKGQPISHQKSAQWPRLPSPNA